MTQSRAAPHTYTFIHSLFGAARDGDWKILKKESKFRQLLARPLLRKLLWAMKDSLWLYLVKGNVQNSTLTMSKNLVFQKPCTTIYRLTCTKNWVQNFREKCTEILAYKSLMVMPSKLWKFEWSERGTVEVKSLKKLFPSKKEIKKKRKKNWHVGESNPDPTKCISFCK